MVLQKTLSKILQCQLQGLKIIILQVRQNTKLLISWFTTVLKDKKLTYYYENWGFR